MVMKSNKRHVYKGQTSELTDDLASSNLFIFEKMVP